MIKRIVSNWISNVVITKNKVIRSELESICKMLTAQNKKPIIIKVLEIGPGERDIWRQIHH